MTTLDVILLLLVGSGYAIGCWFLWGIQQTLRGISDALWIRVDWRGQQGESLDDKDVN